MSGNDQEEFDQAEETVLEDVQETAAAESSEMVMPSIELLESELNKELYKRNYTRTIRNTVFVLVVVAATAVLLAVLFLPVLQITGSSMSDTLQDKDIVVAVNGSEFKTGDIIAFYYNNNVLVKRVIATSGDWVDIDDEGNVSVNGEVLQEPYITDKAKGECNIDLPYQVPDGSIFVMGDHRAVSIDSRNKAVGPINKEVVVGKLVLRVWPLKEIALLNQ